MTDRRRMLAGGVLRIAQGALPPETGIELTLGKGRTGKGATATGRDPTRIVIRDPDALVRVLFGRSSDALADAYLRGDVDVVGDITAAIVGAGDIDLRHLGVTDARRLLRWGMELRRGTPPPRALHRSARLRGRRHSPARDLAAVRFHYDVALPFYGSWLDRRLTYSCAYFPDDTTTDGASASLDEAQEAKLELVVAKLGARTGQRMLDVGSGWGSLVNHAAERHGVEAVGITLSQRQADEANARARAMGVADLARSEVRDYRDLAALGSFDMAASVGMFEHVGRVNLATYFRAVYAALRPGGLFLNHGIATTKRLGPRLRRQSAVSPGSFVDRYVFPDGELVPIEEAVAAARGAGFEVIDLQSLRPHYTLTLAAWVDRLERAWPDAVASAGTEVARTWRLYMSAARLGFERGDIDVFQALLARPRGKGAPAPRPLRRWWL